MQRSIDGPDGQYLSSQEAGKWIGISEDLFEDLAAQEDWIAPVYFKRLKRWFWLDVVVLAHIHHQRGLLGARSEPPGGPRKKGSE